MAKPSKKPNFKLPLIYRKGKHSISAEFVGLPYERYRLATYPAALINNLLYFIVLLISPKTTQTLNRPPKNYHLVVLQLQKL